MGGFAVVLVVVCGITTLGVGEPQGLIQGNIPGNVNRNNQNNNNNNQGSIFNRQAGGLSFAIPGLSLLQGNNGGIGGGGNLFGPVTVTRTLVSTVATVTTQSFRTCTTTMQGLMPCVSGPATGRRKKRAPIPIWRTQTPSMALIFGGTTLVNPYQVTQYLRDHRPGSSIIYPPGYNYVEEAPQTKFRQQRAPLLLQQQPAEVTTILYPSQDTPDTAQEELDSFQDDQLQITTETPDLLNNQIQGQGQQQESEEEDDNSGEVTTLAPLQQVEEFGGEILENAEKARVGFPRTTTFTTVIRVTSVATTLATGPSATLTVSYAGCMPQSLPVSGMPCTTP